MILDSIVQKKKETLLQQSISYKKEEYLEAIGRMPKPQSFYRAIKKPGLSIIGEIKKASPSKGMIKEDFNPIEIARTYEKAVDAISVLTEEHFFIGRTEYLQQVHDAVSLPILRKDFILEEVQIYEGRRLGASSILLIASILDKEKLQEFIQIIHSLDMDALVEVHGEEEVTKAIEAGAKIIGVNNRNLNDFSVDLHTTLRLRRYIPEDILLISESGIHSKEDIQFLWKAGIDGILVGESFMRTNNILEKAKEFRMAYGDQD